MLDTRSVTTSLKTYKKLHTLEFDSTRKRMSVIVQHPNGKIYLITKGAESSVLPRCVTGPIAETGKHVDQCAMAGLRTLTVAMKEMSPNELSSFEKALQQAMISLERRDERIMEVFDLVEDGLVVLGATAVEDKLQDGVEETLRSLRLAGIGVWILTGKN